MHDLPPVIVPKTRSHQVEEIVLPPNIVWKGFLGAKACRHVTCAKHSSGRMYPGTRLILQNIIEICGFCHPSGKVCARLESQNPRWWLRESQDFSTEIARHHGGRPIPVA